MLFSCTSSTILFTFSIIFLLLSGNLYYETPLYSSLFLIVLGVDILFTVPVFPSRYMRIVNALLASVNLKISTYLGSRCNGGRLMPVSVLLHCMHSLTVMQRWRMLTCAIRAIILTYLLASNVSFSFFFFFFSCVLRRRG